MAHGEVVVKQRKEEHNPDDNLSWCDEKWKTKRSSVHTKVFVLC